MMRLAGTIWVSGAAGSIGSAICRRALQFPVSHVYAQDQDETGLFELQRRVGGGDERFTPVLCSLGSDNLRRQLGKVRPECIIHAAAYKHVPVLERHAAAAVINNCAHTRHLLQAAAAAGCRNLLLISTDKAARPGNVLGASKRLAELVVQWAAKDSSLRLASLRLPNIYGSRGSVVRIFARQIASGGPVTVTHPEMERYFISLRQSLHWIFAASRQAEPGVIWMPPAQLPVRVVDLAESMITAAGKRIGADIAVQFTGLRPGERLREPLLGPGERFQSIPGCRLRKILGPAPEPFLPWVDQAIAAAESGEEAKTRRILQEFMLAIQQPPGHKFSANFPATMDQVC